LAVLVLGCSKQEATNQNSDSVSLAVENDTQAASQMVYSYVDKRGRIQMVSRLEDVPKEYQDQILATDTSRSREQRLNSSKVVVLDLRKDGVEGPINYSLIDLDKIDQARPTARTPQDAAQLGRWVADKAVNKLRSSLGLASAGSSEGSPIILYSAPWCGFCKKAARYLEKKGVAFVELNIEQDRHAAFELSKKLRAANLSGSGIPVLDISGTIVVGFNKERIDELLNE
jgi:glutaredoxin